MGRKGMWERAEGKWMERKRMEERDEMKGMGRKGVRGTGWVERDQGGKVWVEGCPYS